MKMHRYVIAILIITSVLLLSSCSVTVPSTQNQITVHPSTTSLPATNTISSSTIPTPDKTTGATSPAQLLSVHFIDVGQGDAILIDEGETEILIDGGERSPGVVDYLRQYVDGPLETLVATHPHADHIGGLIAVLDAFEVEDIWTNGETSTSKTYADFIAAVNNEGATVHIARMHDAVVAGDLSLPVYNPTDTKGATNNNSVVLTLEYGAIDFMFMGDAEVEAEGRMMITSSMQLPDVDILKVGHHGSRTASSPDFLSIIRPEVAIYMAAPATATGILTRKRLQLSPRSVLKYTEQILTGLSS